MKTLPLSGRFPFLALEGGDGSGKTSMRQHIFGRLRDSGMTPLSTITTSWLLPESTELITKAKYAGMQFAAERITGAYVSDKEEFTRRQLMTQLPLRPCVVDRFVLSDVANNAVLFAIPHRATIEAYRASEVLEPDVIIWLDTPPEVAVERLAMRGARRRHPWEVVEQQRRMYDAFRNLFEDNPLELGSKFIRLDNSGTRAETLAQLDAAIVEPLLRSLNRKAGQPWR